MRTCPLFLIDFYKACHAEQYPVGLTKMVSPYTPRMSRLKDVDKVTFFGLQYFCKEYLIKGFNENFFSIPEEEVMKEYTRVLNATLGNGAYNPEKIRKLHKLGYLPIEIHAVPEGMRTAIGVPQLEVTNTHPDFVWIVNTIETMLSCTLWHMQVSAEVGYRYRQIVNKYYNLTCGELTATIPARMLGDFSMRGQQSVESATKSSAAWLLSFYNTATVPAILFLEEYYNCDCTKEDVGLGAISTEHSVMCSNFAVDGDEITHIKRLLTEIYPNHSFSMVSDSYDFWNLVNNILPQCKEEVVAHRGLFSIRGDSGDPVEIMAGKEFIKLTDYDYECLTGMYPGDWLKDYLWDFEDGEEADDVELYATYKGKYYHIVGTAEWTNERGAWTDRKYWFVENYKTTFTEIEPSAQTHGLIWALDQIFGSTTNEKGYKVLNEGVRGIYGDSITPTRCEQVYSRLEALGYAINNVILGVGSFSFMCLEEEDAKGNRTFNPYTRDTFGIAVKATYAEDQFGKPIMIFKNPKECSFKKSQKGCCVVALDGQSYTDEHNWVEACEMDNLLQPVFKNGEMLKEYSLKEIRQTLHGGLS